MLADCIVHMRRVPVAVWVGVWAQFFVFVGAVQLYFDGQAIYGGPGGSGGGGSTAGFDNRCGLSHFFLMPLLGTTAVSIAHVLSAGKRHLYDVRWGVVGKDAAGGADDTAPDLEFKDMDRYDKLNAFVLLVPVVCIVGYVLIFWVGSFGLFFYFTAIGLLPNFGIAAVLVVLGLLGGQWVASGHAVRCHECCFWFSLCGARLCAARTSGQAVWCARPLG